VHQAKLRNTTLDTEIQILRKIDQYQFTQSQKHIHVFLHHGQIETLYNISPPKLSIFSCKPNEQLTRSFPPVQVALFPPDIRRPFYPPL